MNWKNHEIWNNKWALKAKEILILVIGCFLLALAFNMFYRTNNLITGGVSGLSIIIEDLFDIKPWIFILISNIFLFLLGWYYLGNTFASKTLLGTFFFPIAVTLTENVQPMTDELLLAAIYGALLSGLGLGLIFKSGGSTGGADIPPQIFHKKFHISVGTGMFIIDGIVVLTGGLNYGWENVLYAVIALFIGSYTVDRVLLGFNQSKAVYIISDHSDKIRDYILNEISRGITILDGKGAYTQKEKEVLLCVVENNEYIQIKKFIDSIDENAFLIVTTATEVHGEGFYR